MPKQMSKFCLIMSLLLLAACAPSVPSTTPTPADTEAEVRQLVEDFGTRLQNVSLLAPDAGEQMATHYAALVTPELLAAWQADPLNAPGRQTSSPWPDRIDILSMEQLDAQTYAVSAEIVEATSDNPDVHRQPVEITVSRVNGEWLISAYATHEG